MTEQERQEWLADCLARLGAPTMTKAEWLTCTDPDLMLRFLLGTNHPRLQAVESFPACKTSDRKLRMFACACYHRIRHMLPLPLAQPAVEVAERVADGMLPVEELQLAETRLREPLDAIEGPWRASLGAERIALLPTHEALALALQVVWLQAPKAAWYASSNAHYAVAAMANPGAASSDGDFGASQVAEKRVQADLVRDIFGNHFRSTAIDPTCLTWKAGLIQRLAQTIYDEPAFDRLPLVATALEEAGCDNAEILAHLRGPGPHVRGCWALDLVLGKE